MTFDADVLILGAGPGGSTCATVLAEKGHRVLVLEKETFPRFHIGESLLPCDLPIFKRLGISLDQGPFLRKAGAEFFDERSGDHKVYLFKDGLTGTPPYAYQVERATFDHHLMTRAREVGAIVQEGERVKDARFFEDHVEAESDRATYRARYLIDATGQDAFLARRSKSVEAIKDFGIVAVFCHFDGLKPEITRELETTGNIHVLMVEDGWVWLIPLHGGRLSVGVVTRQQGVTDTLLDTTIAASKHIQRLIEGATRTEQRVIRNFSYRNAMSRGARWGCVGDASIFLDPVFSSGVSLAMLAGEQAADLISSALGESRENDPDLLAPVAAKMHTAYVAFASLIGSFYKTKIVEHIFFAKQPDLSLRAGLISVLAGDVWRDDNRFQKMLTGSKRKMDPTLPQMEAVDGSAS